MAVDGIGRPPVPGLPSQAPGVGSADIATRTEFTVQAPDAAKASDAVAPIETDLVRRLELGHITQGQYLDTKAEQAVAHLVGRLPADQVDLIRATLRDQLSEDPIFLRLLRQVTAEHDKR